MQQESLRNDKKWGEGWRLQRLFAKHPLEEQRVLELICLLSWQLSAHYGGTQDRKQKNIIQLLPRLSRTSKTHAEVIARKVHDYSPIM